MARTKKDNKAPGDLWLDAPEVPRAGIADASAREKSARRNRLIIKTSAIASPILLVGLTFFVVNNWNQEAPPAPIVQVEPQARSVAVSAVESWLKRSPSPLPGATLLSWDDFTELPPAPRDPNLPDQVYPELQTHTLSVMAQTGVLVNVEVLVSSLNGQYAVVGTPSVQPQAPVTDTQLTTPVLWPGTEEDAPSDSVAKSVTAWVTAFTSGDPVALRQVVGDPDAAHSYVTLDGAENVTSTIATSAWVTEASSDGPVRTSTMLVNVNLTMTWPDQDPDKVSGTTSTSYDLMVIGADTAAPRVVAWGGTGSGRVLTEFSNSVDVVIPADTDNSVVTPTEGS